MKLEIAACLQLLERSPRVLHTLLYDLSDDWTRNNEGTDTWSPFDVVGHMIVCEKNDFMTRAEIILSDVPEKFFTPIDMTAHFEWNKGKTMNDVLAEFAAARESNISKLRGLNLSAADLERTGMHRKIGEVRLSELLATWVAHDLTHTAQITRVMAKQYKEATGPFIEFLRILK